MQDIDIINKIMELAELSKKTGDVPIGAIVVKDNIIIGEGFNTREKDQNILGHAEINAIREASVKLNNWNLSGCDLYVTLKPCEMCMQIIKQSRLNNVFYLLDKPDNKKEYNKTSIVKLSNLDNEKKYAKILGDFFANLREK